MAGNTELLDVYTGRFKVLVVDKSGTGRRSKKAIVNVSTMVTDIRSRHQCERGGKGRWVVGCISL